jgi:putative ABC transport system permease protein
MFGDAVRDVRHGMRSLLRSPLFTAVTVLTLTLGIGAAVAMFTVADGVLLRPLPYGNADRLVTMYEAGAAGGVRVPSYPAFEDWQGQLTAFEAVTFIRGDEFRLRGPDGAQRLLAGYVSDDFFHTIEASPVLGRVFDGADGPDVVLLSHGLWQRHFASDRSIIGQTITTSDASFTVIGVMRAAHVDGVEQRNAGGAHASLAVVPCRSSVSLMRPPSGSRMELIRPPREALPGSPHRT